ncbi:MAG: MFS transporter [Candidatus Helarchaeota archaeon]
MVYIQSDSEFELEASKWTNYHTFLASFSALVTFFGLFSIVFTGLCFNRMAISFGWDSADTLIIFAIISISGLFSVLPRYFADRFGRKPLIIILNNIFLILIIGSTLAPETSSFMIFRFFAGLFGVNIASVMISEEVPARHRGRALGAATGIGMTSSLLAAYLYTFTGQSEDMWRYLYAIVCTIGMILITILWFKIKETKRFAHIKAKGKEYLNSSLLSVFHKKYLKILVLSSLVLLLTNWIYMTIKRYFVFFLTEERGSLGFNEEVIGTWMIFIYVGSILGYYFSGYFADLIGRKKTIYITVCTYFIGSVIFLYTWEIWLIFMGLFILNISFAIYRMIADILAVEFFPTELRSSGSGWIIAFASISSIVGNFIMYFIVESLGEWGLSFFIVGTICLIALVIVTLFIPETKQRVVEEIYLTEIEKLEV